MREKLLMNKDWLYYFGEPEYKQPKKTSSDQTYRGSRGENARGPARRDFLDISWRHVDLPHDFVNENGPDQDLIDGEKHKYPLNRGTAWYRRYFRLDEADKDKRITLLFDGVSTKCEVYVNSMLLKRTTTTGHPVGSMRSRTYLWHRNWAIGPCSGLWPMWTGSRTINRPGRRPLTSSWDGSTTVP